MADEIKVLSGDGKNSYELLFLFPVASPKQVAGANVVVTPSSSLPLFGAAICDTAEKAALDAGTSAFRVVSMGKQPGMTGPELIAGAQARYAAEKGRFDAWYSNAFAHIGQEFNAS